ncbi:MAG: hypothetical protein JWO57_3009 [Pseudonocardiales bacterium]|nr:hypothetical protein [Pseudonocardiales bacterium]
MRALAVVALVALAVLVWGGYDRGWRWTGLNPNITLWDWLQVLALPLALGVTPLLWHHRQRLSRNHRTAMVALLLGFAALASAGYLVPMSWTGFTGNTLWDWLELALLPLVVATASVWAGIGAIRRKHLVTSGIAAVGLLVLVVCGYLVPWSWTGFTGNTAWDWIKLLLLPLIVPCVLVPVATRQLGDRYGPPPTRAVDH